MLFYFIYKEKKKEIFLLEIIFPNTVFYNDRIHFNFFYKASLSLKNQAYILSYLEIFFRFNNFYKKIIVTKFQYSDFPIVRKLFLTIFK